MEGRNFDNFISAFVDQYRDGFVPDKFYLWSAINTVASCMERKVWLPWGKINFYPNMYIFLVSKPGVGKSSAIRPGQKLIKKMAEKHNRIVRSLPNKVTEPKLLDILNDKDFFLYKGTHYSHTSVYYCASEASSCFNDPYGGFADTITALYDGDDITKATVSRPIPIKVENPCVNIIAGCTFNYLNKLLTTEGIMGGFASRITYVIYNEKVARKSNWETDTRDEKDNLELEHKLIDDLAAINTLTGPFKADKAYQQAWNDWFPVFDKALQETPNEKLQALLVRKSTAMKKLPMILCAAEGNDMILKERHWTTALRLMDEVEKDLPSMIREGQAAMLNTPEGVNSAIFKILSEQPNITNDNLIATLTLMGHNNPNIAAIVNNITKTGVIQKDAKGGLKLLGNPDFYL